MNISRLGITRAEQGAIFYTTDRKTLKERRTKSQMENSGLKSLEDNKKVLIQQN